MTFQLRAKIWRDNYVTVRTGTYPDGSTKLTLIGRYGQILCDATVSLVDMGEVPPPGSVFLRNYGDTEGVLKGLQDAGVLGATDRIIETGTHTRDPLLRRPVHQCKLLNTNV